MVELHKDSSRLLYWFHQLKIPEFHQDPILITAQTPSFVNTNGSSTIGAHPPDFLHLGKLAQTYFPDVFQIFQHAHLVFDPISLVELF